MPQRETKEQAEIKTDLELLLQAPAEIVMADRSTNPVPPDPAPTNTTSNVNAAESGATETNGTKRALVAAIIAVVAAILAIPFIQPVVEASLKLVQAFPQKIIPFLVKLFGVAGFGTAGRMAGATLGALTGAGIRGWKSLCISLLLVVGLVVLTAIQKEAGVAIGEVIGAYVGAALGAAFGTAVGGAALGATRVMVALGTALGIVLGTEFGLTLVNGNVNG